MLDMRWNRGDSVENEYRKSHMFPWSVVTELNNAVPSKSRLMIGS